MGELCWCDGAQHTALKAELSRSFSAELQDAEDELERLRLLQDNAYWYNFEVTCQKWDWPWHTSWLLSPIVLDGIHYSFSYKRGKRHESYEFPVWYEGLVEAAPLLPMDIVSNEIELAERYVERCRENVNAPFDYAPGGVKYEAVRRATNLPTQV